MSSYCYFATNDPLHGPYHDREYGFPLSTDNEFFERLVLEINQAGLSWATILKKRADFVRAYDQFDVDKVAAYGETERKRLLSDATIVRNKLKIDAAIHNAKQFQEIRKSHGSFKLWLDESHPLSKDKWVKVFKKQFEFVGGEIINELLMSTGYLPGAHRESCATYAVIARLNPPWMRTRLVVSPASQVAAV